MMGNVNQVERCIHPLCFCCFSCKLFHYILMLWVTFNGTCFNFFDLYSAFFFHLEMSHPVFYFVFCKHGLFEFRCGMGVCACACMYGNAFLCGFHVAGRQRVWKPHRRSSSVPPWCRRAQAPGLQWCHKLFTVDMPILKVQQSLSSYLQVDITYLGGGMLFSFIFMGHIGFILL